MCGEVSLKVSRLRPVLGELRGSVGEGEVKSGSVLWRSEVGSGVVLSCWVWALARCSEGELFCWLANATAEWIGDCGAAGMRTLAAALWVSWCEVVLAASLHPMSECRIWNEVQAQRRWPVAWPWGPAMSGRWIRGAL